uniref:LysM domain-containing protein n=1 Tax=Oryza meridionalis TaxID=40149 RepID=A0A0E0F051_9ORYZ
MAGESRRRRRAAAEAVAWCLALGVVALLLVGSVEKEGDEEEAVVVVRGARLAAARPCEEIYVVEEGETLHSISDRCGDPYILEQNPHVHDPDDVFPGLVIKITPRSGRRN